MEGRTELLRLAERQPDALLLDLATRLAPTLVERQKALGLELAAVARVVVAVVQSDGGGVDALGGIALGDVGEFLVLATLSAVVEERRLVVGVVRVNVWRGKRGREGGEEGRGVPCASGEGSV